MRTWSVMLMAAMMLCAGCATAPAGPTVLVLPGNGKSLEQFQTDLNACRTWSDQQAKEALTAASSWEMQRAYDYSFMQCMYAKGHQVPSAPTLSR
jgi:hypothetical protein